MEQLKLSRDRSFHLWRKYLARGSLSNFRSIERLGVFEVRLTWKMRGIIEMISRVKYSTRTSNFVVGVVK